MLRIISNFIALWTFFSFLFFSCPVNCAKKPMVWLIHRDIRNLFSILSQSSGIQRRSSIESLTTDEKIALCESEIFLFISNNYPKAESLSESEEEEEEEEDVDSEPWSLPSLEINVDDDDDDFHSADMESMPISEEDTDSNSSMPPLCDASDADSNLSMSPVGETDAHSDTSLEGRTKNLVSREHAYSIAKAAKKIYPFDEDYDNFDASVIFRAMEYVLISVAIETRRYHHFRSLPCFLSTTWSWFLADGYIKDTFFTVQKGKIDDNLKITGLLDMVPSMDELSIEELEETYLKGLEVVERNRARRNLCLLDGFTKFRLCSIAHVAWGLQYAREYLNNWNFVVEKFENECLRDVVFHFATADEKDERIKISSNLLPCFVNGDSEGAEFYLAADPVFRDVVYMVFLEKEDENVAPRYVLDARLTSVTCLRMIRAIALMEPYLPDDQMDVLKELQKKKKKERNKQDGPMLKKLLSSVSFSSQTPDGENKSTLKRLLSNISFSSRTSDDNEEQPVLRRFLNSISFNSRTEPENISEEKEETTLKKLMKNISFTRQTSTDEEKPSLRKLLSGISFKKGPT